MYTKYNRFPLAALVGAAAMISAASPQQPVERTSYVIEAASSESAARAVRSAGGRITHELPIINGVSALLTHRQAATLKHDALLTLFSDAPVWSSQLTAAAAMSLTPDPYQRPMLNVPQLASAGVNGAGVLVAVVDSGILQPASRLGYSPATLNNPMGTDPNLWLANDLNGHPRIAAQYDAIHSIVVDATHPWVSSINDAYGHGTHIAGLILSSDSTDGYLEGQPAGIAPDAHLISVKAFNDKGVGTYSAVINGLNWIYANRNTYGRIGVVNLSFGAAPQSFYWNDPIDQAVMKLWQAGIVVVASAGNLGPSPMTITVPGNTPYVITVGAMTDNWTDNYSTDDGVTSFSSAGPTYEGFVKPEIIAPGGHLMGIMSKTAGQYLPQKYSQFASDDAALFVMSGTSQAAAVTSGVVALMLQADPTLAPDQVKCRLLVTAAAKVGTNGKASYSVFQQGAGLVNAYAAVHSKAANCANVGLDVAKDIAGTAHFGGPAQQDPKTGLFYVVSADGNRLPEDGFLWNQQFAKNQGYMWNQGYLWSQGYMWNQGFLWNQGYMWNQGFMWNQSYLKNESTVGAASAPMDSESWNNQE